MYPVVLLVILELVFLFEMQNYEFTDYSCAFNFQLK